MTKRKRLEALEPVMHFRCGSAAGGPKARSQASPGQRPGSWVKMKPSPERARPLGSPFQGWFVFSPISQGVALGWLVSAPLVLPPTQRTKCMTGSSHSLISHSLLIYSFTH